MRFCPDCGEELSEDMKFYPTCGRQLVPRENTARASKALRWISGALGVLCILAAIGGLSYYAESGLVSELIVDIVSIVVGIACLLMALVPDWVSTRLKIKLEKGSVFGAVSVTLFILFIAAVALGPEPPGGWWGW